MRTRIRSQVKAKVRPCASACLSICLLFLLVGCKRGERNFSAALSSFQIEEGFKLEVAAMEPEVVDPVCIAFDENGRMYAVEMSGYPEGPPEGRIKLLEDLDGDGYFEKSTVFADDLQFPTSVLPWKGGVLVADPPDIRYYRDADGDNKADIREVLFTGFAKGNTQHNLNGLRWGIDNWVYGANGGNHGQVSSPSTKFQGKISIRRLDFRFDPESRQFQPTSGYSGGFGIAFDEWGQRFVTHNRIHIQHVVLPLEYLRRNPYLAIRSSNAEISDHLSASRIYPISKPETRPNHPEQSGYFSAACGITYYGGGAFPEGYNGNIFVADPASNLVHRDILVPDGPSFIARRGGEGREFLASRDNWCRPVNFEVGPDGALYMVDMYRKVIEHPEWIAEWMKKGLDLRAGHDKGRIYRILPKGGLKRRRPHLAEASAAELVKELSNSNQWWRMTAQRLLVERKDKTAIPLLEKLSQTSDNPLARLHALWTLHGLGALRLELVEKALDDPHPGIREHAVRLAEGWLESSEKLQAKLLGMADDPDHRVRFQLSLTLGYLKKDEKIGALIRIALRDVENKWSRYAILTSLSEGADWMLRALLSDRSFRSQESEGRKEFIRELASIVGAKGRAQEFEAVLSALNFANLSSRWQVVGLDGLAEGIARAESKPSVNPRMRAVLERLIASSSTRHGKLRAALRLAHALGLSLSAAQLRAHLRRAKASALDSKLDLEERIESIKLLEFGSYRSAAPTLLSLLDTRHPLQAQLAAIDVLSKMEDQEIGRALVGNFRSFSPQVRRRALQVILARPPYHRFLLDAIQSGKLTAGELALDLEQRRRLSRSSDPEVKRRALAIFGDDDVVVNRKQVVREYLNALYLRGDPERGGKIFDQQCAKCHMFQGRGTAVGPDLSDASSRSAELLLNDILDPNGAVEADYTNYIVVTSRGDTISGIIAAESESSVTLRRAGGEETTIPRSQIKQMYTDGLSLMPEGMEQNMTRQDIADLIAFLHKR